MGRVLRGGPKLPAMRIAKPLLLVTTPLGIVTGLIEAYRLVGGLAILMFAMMARALSVRIGLSIALFVLLMIAWYFGGISPHGVG
jgi:hypothetical protein